ncbi:A24 family peptidase [Cognatiyoonia sp. IB215182]|nr:A24 family peptidase [Cognatiyoonia sp. IB215182]
MLLSMVLIGLCIWASYIDLTQFRIPDSANIAVFAVGVIAIAWIDLSLLPSHLIASILTLTVFWLAGEILFRIARTDMLGAGDAKLLGAAVMWGGIWGLPSLLLVAATTGIAYALLARRQAKRVPFAPFICLGLLTIWFYGPIRV